MQFRFAPLSVLALLCILPSCASNSRSGSGFAVCNRYSFQKEKLAEAELLNDAKAISSIYGTAMVEDLRSDDAAYLVVHTRPGYDLAIRERLLALGYRSIESVPATARPGSKTWGKPFPDDPR